MEFTNDIEQNNALLKTDNLINDWSKYCNANLISKILADLRSFNYPIVNVVGSQSYWDVSEYIDNNWTSCTFEEKIKAIYAFANIESLLLLDGKRIQGSANFIAAIEQSNRNISKDLFEYLIDCGYKWSHGDECIL